MKKSKLYWLYWLYWLNIKKLIQRMLNKFFYIKFKKIFSRWCYRRYCQCSSSNKAFERPRGLRAMRNNGRAISFPRSRASNLASACRLRRRTPMFEQFTFCRGERVTFDGNIGHENAQSVTGTVTDGERRRIARKTTERLVFYATKKSTNSWFHIYIVDEIIIAFLFNINLTLLKAIGRSPPEK